MDEVGQGTGYEILKKGMFSGSTPDLMMME